MSIHTWKSTRCITWLTVLAMPSSGNVSNLTSYSRCHLPRKSQYDLLRNVILTFGLRTFCTFRHVEIRTILFSKSCGCGGGWCCIGVIATIHYFSLPPRSFARVVVYCSDRCWLVGRFCRNAKELGGGDQKLGMDAMVPQQMTISTVRLSFCRV